MSSETTAKQRAFLVAIPALGIRAKPGESAVVAIRRWAEENPERAAMLVFDGGSDE